MLNVVLAGAGALAASIALVSVARQLTHRRLILDHPNERSLHRHPTPRGGGIGIVIPVCLALAGWAWLMPESTTAATGLVGGGLLIAAAGLADDVRDLPPLARLVAHVVGALLVAAGIGSWHSLTWPGLGSVGFGWAAIPFTLLWVVGLTNAYNFMDGSDGIAGSQALVAGLGWVALGYMNDDPFLMVVGAVIASASLGFLFFNWSPASIFMGDVGSSFLGFVLAALTVKVSTESPSSATAGVLFVWPFVFDAGVTLVRRALRRENLLRAHRGHLYQRLILTGISHRAVALVYGSLASVGVIVGLSVGCETRAVTLVGVASVSLLAGVLWLWVIHREQTREPMHPFQ